MKKLVVLFSGRGTNLAYILKHLHKKDDFKVVMALTNNPNAKGIDIAKSYNIPVEIVESKKFSNREDFDRIVVDKINNYSPNLTILAGFMRILTPVFTYSIKAINLHPSLLPKYKGLCAIERSFESGDNICGVSVHWVTSELDSGKLILQKSFERSSDMSFEEFESNIKRIEKIALKDAIIEVFKEEILNV
ncbi:Phosphoribosylglycinamide formyltransferase [hydrothermal vent metagenome]|uniref:phosphoribosylglycinamide formyltransferase 1 n=1 Tax=hydrothermal vent metagenome TaxID=652676 RepID=A0A1W1EHA2_9ZZZZ